MYWMVLSVKLWETASLTISFDSIRISHILSASGTLEPMKTGSSLRRVWKTQDCFIQLLQHEIFFCYQTFQTVCQLHRDHSFKQVMEDIRRKSCNGMEIGEMIRENTTPFCTIILHSFICLYFLNQGIMGIFFSPFKTTGHCIWFLHFCPGGKAESAEICSHISQDGAVSQDGPLPIHVEWSWNCLTAMIIFLTFAANLIPF